MNFEVALTDRAYNELDRAGTWWADNRSPEQAFRWYNGFIQAIRSLSESPESRPLAEENPSFPFELRQLNFGLGKKPTHRAVFTIYRHQVIVLRIRHLAQAALSGDDPTAQ